MTNDNGPRHFWLSPCSVTVSVPLYWHCICFGYTIEQSTIPKSYHQAPNHLNALLSFFAFSCRNYFVLVFFGFFLAQMCYDVLFLRFSYLLQLVSQMASLCLASRIFKNAWLMEWPESRSWKSTSSEIVWSISNGQQSTQKKLSINWLPLHFWSVFKTLTEPCCLQHRFIQESRGSHFLDDFLRDWKRPLS